MRKIIISSLLIQILFANDMLNLAYNNVEIKIRNNIPQLMKLPFRVEGIENITNTLKRYKITINEKNPTTLFIYDVEEKNSSIGNLIIGERFEYLNLPQWNIYSFIPKEELYQYIMNNGKKFLIHNSNKHDGTLGFYDPTKMQKPNTEWIFPYPLQIEKDTLRCIYALARENKCEKNTTQNSEYIQFLTDFNTILLTGHGAKYILFDEIFKKE